MGVKDARYVLPGGKAGLIGKLESSIARMTDPSSNGKAGDRKKAIEAKDEVRGEPWDVCDNSLNASHSRAEYQQ